MSGTENVCKLSVDEQNLLGETRQEADDGQDNAKKDNRCKAIVAINIFGLCVTIIGTLFKIISSEGFSLVEFVFFRCVAALIVSIAWNVQGGLNPIKLFPANKKCRFYIRSLFGHSSFIFFCTAVPLAPLSLLMIIFNTCPFWISIVAFCLLREPIIGVEIVGMCLCFAMVIVIASQAESDEATGLTLGSSLLGIFFVLCAAFVNAVSNVLDRYLNATPAPVIIFWHSLNGLFLISIYIVLEATISGNGFRFYTGRQYLIALISTAVDALAMTSSTVAFQSDSSGFIGLLLYTSVVYAYLLDLIVFQQSLNVIELVATVVILIVAVVVGYLKVQDQKKKAAEAKKQDIPTELAEKTPLTSTTQVAKEETSQI